MNPDIPRLTERWPQLAPPALGIAALMLFLVLGRPPTDAYGWRMLFEIGHMPLFGITALLMLRIVRLMRDGAELERGDFLVALLATAILSLVSEAAQVIQPGRHPSVGDAIYNLTGAVCFIVITAALRPAVWRTLGRDGPVVAKLVLIGAVLVLGLILMPLAGVAWSYGMRAVTFPVLADFAGAWQRPFLNVARSDLARVPAPHGWVEQSGTPVARVTFFDAPWPGVTVREPRPDWSGYEAFRFQVWSGLESPVEILLQVEDSHRHRPHRDRFNGSFIVMPGLNDFSVSLETIARGPRDRSLDLSDISQFVLFSRRPEEPFELYFSSFWLEGGLTRIADMPGPD